MKIELKLYKRYKARNGLVYKIISKSKYGFLGRGDGAHTFYDTTFREDGTCPGIKELDLIKKIKWKY